MEHWKIVIFILLIWVSYHLTREMLQDVIGIKHPLVMFGHKPHKRPIFLGDYFSRFWGLIFEIPILIACLLSISLGSLLFGALAIVLFVGYVVFWIYSTY